MHRFLVKAAHIFPEWENSASCPGTRVVLAHGCPFPPRCPGYVKLPPEKFAPKKQGDGGKDLPTEAKKLQLNSAEELYAEIRDKNFNAVGSVLSKKAKVISAAFEVSQLSCPPAAPIPGWTAHHQAVGAAHRSSQVSF